MLTPDILIQGKHGLRGDQGEAGISPTVPTGLLFSITTGVAGITSALDNKTVSPDLINAFTSQRKTLSTNATVAINQPGQQWTLTNSDPASTFTVSVNGQALDVVGSQLDGLNGYYQPKSRSSSKCVASTNGKTGLNGSSGSDGEAGGNGLPAPDFILEVDTIIGSLAVISQGGDGGAGGRGGQGGNGTVGGNAGQGPDRCFSTTLACRYTSTARGGTGGAGGNAGNGGNGGVGGDGGSLTVLFYSQALDLQAQAPGGAGGAGGVGGDGGQGGTGGRNETAPGQQPTTALNGSNGSNGGPGNPGRVGRPTQVTIHKLSNTLLAAS